MSSPPSSKKPRIGSKSLSGASTSHEFAVPPPHHDHTSPGPTTPLTRDRDDEFKKTMKNSMKLPTTVNDEEFRKWCLQVSGKSIEFPKDVLSADDPYNLTHLKFAFLIGWRQHILAFKIHSEFDLRAGINTLMREAFDSKCRNYVKKNPPVTASYRTEQELYVPVISSNRAKTDAVVWLPIPSPLASFFQMLDNNHVFSAEASGEHDLLATFIFEARLQDEATAVRQLCLDLCSAQHQRRALGFNSFRIYGAVLFGSVLTLYSSEWDGDVIFIRPTTIVFDLSQFQNFLTLFVFLCHLADSIVGQIEEMRSESTKNEDSLRKRLATATQNQWRSSKPLSSSRFVEGEMDDSREEGTSQGLDDENDDIRDDDPKLLHPPLRKIYVKNVQASDKDIQRWANQSAQELANCPAEIS